MAVPMDRAATPSLSSIDVVNVKKKDDMWYAKHARVFVSALITSVINNAENAIFSHDQLIDMLEVELFETAEHRPPSAGYHTIARERITASLLNNDDGQLWELTRMLRRVEWSILLRRHTIAVEEFNKIDKLWPKLRSSSPSLWYLRARMRAGQGYTAEANECWKRALECFAGYEETFLARSEESLLVRLIARLVRERGDEKYRHSEKFEKMLIEGHGKFLKDKEPSELGYFHCDLYRIYLEYLPAFETPDGLYLHEIDRMEQQRLTRVIEVVCHHIEAASIFAAYNLVRYLHKAVGRTTTLHLISDRFGKALANARNQNLLLEFFLGQLYYHCGRNVLKDADDRNMLDIDILNHTFGMLREGLKHAKSCGDGITVLDIKVMMFLIKKKLEIDGCIHKYNVRTGTEHLKYKDIRSIKQQFDKYLNKYASRQDALRISTVIDRFHEIFKITKDVRACLILGHISAFYQRATGDVRWSHPYWVMAANGRRRGELLRAIEGCDAHYERFPNMTFVEKHHLLKTRLRVCHMLGMLKEGVKTAKKLILYCDEMKKRRHASEARYDYLLLKTDLMALCVKEEDQPAYIAQLLKEFARFQDRDEKWMPTSTHAVMKSLLLSAFLADNADIESVGGHQVWKSQHQYEILKDNIIFKLNMTPAEKDFMDFHHCYAQYMGNQRMEALEHCEKMASEYYVGQTHLEVLGVVEERRRRLRMASNWQMLYVLLYTQEFEIMAGAVKEKLGGGFLQINHEKFWKAVDDSYQAFVARGEQRSLARLFFEVGRFCCHRGREEEGLSFWIVALEHLSAVEKYGCVSPRTQEYMPAMFRDISFDMIFDLALPTQMRIDDEERKKLAMDGTFYWTQLRKAHELRRILGSNSIWEDWKMLFHEFETVLEYTSPPIETEVFNMVRDARTLFGPDGYRRGWSSDQNSIELAERMKLAELKVLIAKLDKTEALRAPLSTWSASPPLVRDI
ncbi:hypothetical protein TWF696_009535 [Orbilia brochopaga]|uniref:Uncharacterized protein n=1 Tax=Orbilia brochopaga TaxID=3140254 RepID=A0AAV9UBA7_9PEZI